MTGLPDLVGMMDRYVAEVLLPARAAGRHPEELHVSDLARCPAAVQARRRGRPMLPIATGNAIAMELGFAFEAMAENAYFSILAADGWAIETQVPYVFGERDGHVWAARAHDPMLYGGIGDASQIVFGTADVIARKGSFAVTWDTKATQAEKRKIKTVDPTSQRNVTRTAWVFDASRYEWQIQVGAYALAEGSEYFTTLRWDKNGTAGLAVDWQRTEDWQERVEALIVRQIALTHPDAPDADPAPGRHTYTLTEEDGAVKELPFSLECYLCDYGGCSANKNPRRDAPLLLQEA